AHAPRYLATFPTRRSSDLISQTPRRRATTRATHSRFAGSGPCSRTSGRLERLRRAATSSARIRPPPQRPCVDSALRGVERAFDRVLDDREIGEQARAAGRRQALRLAHALETRVEQGGSAAEIPGRLGGQCPAPPKPP